MQYQTKSNTPSAQAPQSWTELTSIWRYFSWKGESNSVFHLFPVLLGEADFWFSPSSRFVPSFSLGLPSTIQVGHWGPNSIDICSTTVHLQCFHWNFIKIILFFGQQNQEWLHSTGTNTKIISSASTSMVCCHPDEKSKDWISWPVHYPSWSV